jgi:5-methyltetrahydropteroyltriglutamate--homocysteine methyltransferase
VHLCRGNSGHGQGAGGYEPVAARLFQKLPATVYFLEYDTERAGGFEPLRHLPGDKFAVLGVMSTKLPELEPLDLLQRKVDEAAKYVDKERLCLSPQCGFASNYDQTRFTAEDVERKLAHLVKAAEKIWS